MRAQKLFTVKASNFHATYTAGKYVAGSAHEAIEMAREDYRNSSLGRQLKDVGAFRFWVVDPKYANDDE